MFQEKPEDLETVCQVCHARIHGKPVPRQPNHLALIFADILDVSVADVGDARDALNPDRVVPRDGTDG